MRVRSIRHIAEDSATSDRPTGTQATINKAPGVLTEAEAAQFIGMSAAWLKKSRTKRFRRVIDAPPFIRAGVKRVVYRIEDLEGWQERHLEHVGPRRPENASNELATAHDRPSGDWNESAALLTAVPTIPR